MKETFREKVRKEDPCVCNSGKTRGECCGRFSNDTAPAMGFATRAGVATHHFFLWHIATSQLFTDDTGHVLVFLDRAQALERSERLALAADKPVVYAVCGMGDEKWAQFLADNVSYRIVPISMG